MKAAIVGYGSIGQRFLKILSNIPNIEIILCSKKKTIKNLRKNIILCHSIKECILLQPDVVFITNITSAHIPTAKIFAKNLVKMRSMESYYNRICFWVVLFSQNILCGL